MDQVALAQTSWEIAKIELYEAIADHPELDPLVEGMDLAIMSGDLEALRDVPWEETLDPLVQQRADELEPTERLLVMVAWSRFKFRVNEYATNSFSDPDQPAQ